MSRKIAVGVVLGAVLAAFPAVPVWAAEGAAIDTGDTAFLLFSAALVLLMTPGLALFYAGMVRRKNVLGTMMQSFTVMGLISIQWILVGYSLAFGPDHGHLIGGLDWIGFQGIGLEPNPDYAGTIPHPLFAAFQLMFAIITPALIAGAFAERMKFSAFVLFTLLWSTLVYDPLAHWVWGVGGFLRNLGALDFAGGTVVHISSGVSGLVIAVMLGKRRQAGDSMLPHNVPLTVLGAGLLWFGWFGFNAGSALAANGLAANALLVTNTAAAAGAIAWAGAEWLQHQKPTVLGTVSGAVAGLVAITPAAGFVGPAAAIPIGFLSGLICYVAVAVVKPRWGYDDSLDAFGIHGVGGTWGALATGIFATRAVNPAGADGLLAGNPGLLLTQLEAVVITILFAVGATWLIVNIVRMICGVRLTAEQESTGLDLSQHGEGAYGTYADPGLDRGDLRHALLVSE